MPHTDPHAPLRDDVRQLGSLLGETLREQGDNALFDKVETIRRLAKGARSGMSTDAEQLVALLSSLSSEELLPVARAFSQFLNLANIAEQHHRVRRRRSYQRQQETIPQRGSLEEKLPQLLQADGISQQRLLETLSQLSIEFVLTAHPTEVARRTLIRKYNAIAQCLETLDREDLTPGERSEAQRRLKRLVESAWHTDEIRQERPTPLDEAKWGFITIEQTLWQAVPQFLRELDRVLYRHTGERLAHDAAPIRFASWMGGDRDGNPNVTARVTEQVLLQARWEAINLYLQGLDHLYFELSMTDCSPELRQRVGRCHEPYRALMGELRDGLLVTRQWLELRLTGESVPPGPQLYLESAQLAEPLELCYRSLVSCGMTDIAEGELLDMLRQVACFGLTLVRLDIRQESSRHAEAMDAITRYLGLGSYLEWSEEQKQAFLSTELASRRPLIPARFPCSPEVQEVLDTCRVIAQQPPSALGAYVISMATHPSDVLAVRLLQRECGVAQPMRVVPLFETLSDLDGAAASIDRLLSVPIYREAIGDRQEVMIGYSDSAKDAGFMAAAWAQYRAMEQLVSVCERHQVHLTLFHGRGGSVSRGGGPAHQALLSQPPGAVRGSVRITEQGEVIRSKFGLMGVALRTLEVYTSAALEASLMPPPAPKPEWRSLMDLLSSQSLAAYRQVVRQDPRFIPYFRTATPEQELQKLPIGSRPAKRKATGGVESLRAIPWVFAWTQCRLMLPAWLGLNSALQSAINEDKLPLLQQMANDWPFFSGLINMLEMVMAKADPDIAAYYEQRLAPEELHSLGQQLRQDLQHCVELIKTVTGHKMLLQNNPVIRRSIAVRNPYTDPLHLLQAEVLHRHRQAEHANNPLLERASMILLAGIAAGMRNTG